MQRVGGAHGGLGGRGGFGVGGGGLGGGVVEVEDLEKSYWLVG